MNEVSAKVLVNESFDVVNEPVPGTTVLEVCSNEQSDALNQSSYQLISTDVSEPYQPILESYNLKQYPGESSKRDFNPVLHETFSFNDHQSHYSGPRFFCCNSPAATAT